MPSLLTPELLRRLEQFQLLAQRRAKSSLKGERRSKARGQSVEFADYRNYVAGDDFRYLDWNLYGRLDRLFLKLYEEERELPVRVFLDASESMTFGEPRKFDFARQVAAAIGYVALSGFDRVSVIPFPNREPSLAADGTNSPAGISSQELAACGGLRLVDSETGGLQEVTFGRYRMKAYQQTVQNFLQRLREYCQARGINFFTASSNTPLEELLLRQLRQAEVWG